MPGERAGEWDKGGHLRVITAQRFEDRIQLMGSSAGEAKNERDVTCVRTWGQGKCEYSANVHLDLRSLSGTYRLMRSHLQKS